MKPLIFIIVLSTVSLSQITRSYNKLYLPKDTATFKTTVTDTLYLKGVSGVNGDTVKVARISAEYLSDKGQIDWALRNHYGVLSNIMRLFYDGTLYLWNEVTTLYDKVWTEWTLPFFVNGTLGADGFGYVSIGLKTGNVHLKPGAWDIYQNKINGEATYDSVTNVHYYNGTIMSTDTSHTRTMTATTAGIGALATNSTSVIDTLKIDTGSQQMQFYSYYLGAPFNFDIGRLSFAGDTVFEFYKQSNVMYFEHWGSMILHGALTTYGASTATTYNSGNGACEIYPMNQDVRSTAQVTFASVTTPRLHADSLVDDVGVGGNLVFGSSLRGIPNRCVYSSSNSVDYADTMWLLNNYPNNTNRELVFLPGFFTNGRQVRITSIITLNTGTDLYFYYKVNNGSWYNQSFSHNASTSKIDASLFYANYGSNPGAQFNIYSVSNSGNNLSYRSIEMNPANDTLTIKLCFPFATNSTVYNSTLEVIDGVN